MTGGKKKGREDTSSGFPGNVRKSIGLKEKKGKSEWKEKEREREMIVSPGAHHATGCGRAILWRRHSLGSGTGKENIHKGGSVVARRRKESGRSKKEKRGGIERRRRRRREAPTARTSRSFLYLGGVCVRISLLPHLLALRDLQVNSTREKVKILFNPDGWTGRIDGFALIKTKAEPNKSRRSPSSS